MHRSETAQKGTGRDGRRRTLPAILLTGCLLALGHAARADGGGSDCPPPPQPPFTVLAQDSVISFGQFDPVGTGWVEAGTAGGQLDTAYILLRTNDAVSLSFSVGGELRQAGSTGAMPLQVAAQARGRGRWDSGARFSTGSAWGPWQPWLACSDTSPAMGGVTFKGGQICGLQVKARAWRQGVVDGVGKYAQERQITVTIMPSNLGGSD